MKLPQQAQIKFKSDAGELGQVLTWFEQFHHPTIPRPVWLQCQLALAEAFTNVVRHAHHDKPKDTPVEIEVVLADALLEMRVWDHGAAIDLNQIIHDLPLEMDKDAEGGRGLKLMKQMADVLTYTRTPDQRNCLLIVKHFSPVSPSSTLG